MVKYEMGARKSDRFWATEMGWWGRWGRRFLAEVYGGTSHVCGRGARGAVGLKRH